MENIREILNALAPEAEKPAQPDAGATATDETATAPVSTTTATDGDTTMPATEGTTAESINSTEIHSDAPATRSQTPPPFHPDDAERGATPTAGSMAEAPSGKDDNASEGNVTEAERIEQLAEQIDRLTKEYDRMRAEKATAERASDYNHLIEGLPRAVREAYLQVDIASMDKAQYEALKGKVAENIEMIRQETTTPTFAPPLRGIGAHNNEPSEDELSQVLRKMNL